jgi:hypothetical protein
MQLFWYSMGKVGNRYYATSIRHMFCFLLYYGDDDGEGNKCMWSGQDAGNDSDLDNQLAE